MSLDDQPIDPVPVGAPLGRLLDVAFAARLAVMLVGRHGIGKSEYLEAYARERGLKPYILDLSLLEATDLTGLPYREGDVTRFAPPGTLPPATEEGPSLLVLEELNRCDRSVRQPCLQLLTARRLNDYRLPPGCQLAACINPPDIGYDVDELDAALASRFLMVRVEPERKSWLEWAEEAQQSEPLLRFVKRHPQVFDRTPPRSWTFAGRLAEQAIDRNWDGAELERALRALLPPVAARAFALELTQEHEALPAVEDLVLAPEQHVSTLQRLTRDGRLDAVRALFQELDEYLASDDGKAMLREQALRDALRKLVRAAPMDLQSIVQEHLA